MAKRKRRPLRDQAVEMAGKQMRAQAANIKAAEPAKPKGGGSKKYARLPNLRLAVVGLKAAAKEFRVMVGERLTAENDVDDMAKDIDALAKQVKRLNGDLKRGARGS